jgi:stress response protein YsnF
MNDVDWSDQTIEVMETFEQPVLNKTVRVSKEVVIRRKGSDHTETVHNTVRQQQLEVERVPAKAVKK